jgi:hypothetical protein
VYWTATPSLSITRSNALGRQSATLPPHIIGCERTGRGRGAQGSLCPWSHTSSSALSNPGAAERLGSHSLTHSLCIGCFRAVAQHPQCLVSTAISRSRRLLRLAPPSLASNNGLALASCAVHPACVGHAVVARDLNETAQLGAYSAFKLGRLAACLSLAIVYVRRGGAHIGCTRVLKFARCNFLESNS